MNSSDTNNIISEPKNNTDMVDQFRLMIREIRNDLTSVVDRLNAIEARLGTLASNSTFTNHSDISSNIFNLSDPNNSLDTNNQSYTEMLLDRLKNYKQSKDTNNIILTLKELQNLYILTGVDNFIAKYSKELADLYKGLSDFENALQNYLVAIEYYENEHKPMSSNVCMISAANMYVRLDDINNAQKLFDKAGRRNCETRLGMLQSSSNFFRSLLCLIALKSDDIYKILDEYQTLNRNFIQTREFCFIDKILSLPLFFCNTCEEYNRISPLDEECVKILLTIKNATIESNEEYNP
jgi:tetratricopeptide (TPR) repeat protein